MNFFHNPRLYVLVYVLSYVIQSERKGFEMKKTAYELFMGTNASMMPVYRRVWEKDGRYFVKYRGEVLDVTDKAEHFDRSSSF